MLHEIANECNVLLAADGCPVRVEDGPYVEETRWAGEKIVLSYASSGDSFGPVRGSHRNPQQVGIISIAFVARIYVQSARKGALYFEHVRRLHKIRDSFLIALLTTCRTRSQECTLQGGKLVQVKDLTGSFNEAGVVYEITGSIPAAISRYDWAGEAAEELVIVDGLIVTTAYAALDPTDDNDNGIPDNAQQV